MLDEVNTCWYMMWSKILVGMLSSAQCFSVELFMMLVNIRLL